MKSRTILLITLLAIILAGCNATTQLTPTLSITETPADPEDLLAEQITTWQAENPTQEEPTEIATNTPLPTDTPPTATPHPSPDDWRDAPVIPQGISQRAIEIYLQGLEMGRNPHAFSNVGDCGGTPSWFLGSFDLNPQYYSLGEHEYLTSAIAYFAGSFDRYSMAVSPGFNTSSIFAPLWADPEHCNPDEGPIECEFRIQNPSIILIMLGTNDQYHPDEFEEPMRAIIEFAIDQGVLPILASKPDNLEGDHSINRTIYKLALEYELPFWNFWAALQSLPNQGLQEDGAHLTWAPNFFDDRFAMQAGWPWRNLTALQALEAVWQALPTP
jgi:hypothetical protein